MRDGFLSMASQTTIITSLYMTSFICDDYMYEHLLPDMIFRKNAPSIHTMIFSMGYIMPVY